MKATACPLVSASFPKGFHWNLQNVHFSSVLPLLGCWGGPVGLGGKPWRRSGSGADQAVVRGGAPRRTSRWAGMGAGIGAIVHGVPRAAVAVPPPPLFPSPGDSQQRPQALGRRHPCAPRGPLKGNRGQSFALLFWNSLCSMRFALLLLTLLRTFSGTGAPPHTLAKHIVKASCSGGL